MFLTGPDVIKTVVHEEVTHEELGGAMVHNTSSGVAHFAHQSEAETLSEIRRLLSFLPQNNTEDPPRRNAGDDPTGATPSWTRSSPTARTSPTT